MKDRGTERLLAALAWLYFGFAFVIVECRLPYVPVCPYLLLMGNSCPLCGSTRFIGTLLHGIGASPPHPILWTLWFALLISMALRPIPSTLITRIRKATQ